MACGLRLCGSARDFQHKKFLLLLSAMIRYTLLFIVHVLSVIHINGQGCSDAGACSITTFAPKPTEETNQPVFQLHLGATIGAADHSILATDAEVGLSMRLSQQLSVDGKVTYALRSGNDISVNGLGDVYLMLNYKPFGDFSFAGGIKIPMNDADAKNNGLVLPMDYQTSLGTMDLIAAIVYQKSDWLLGLGYQQPLSQNENTFLPLDWPADSPLQEFDPTYYFERKGDLLLRISRVIRMSDRATCRPGLLPSYHLGDDLQRTSGIEPGIDGSSGLTLNATARFEIQTGDTGQFNVNIGFPVIVRETRPDGLTRSFVAGVSYAHSF